MQIKSRFCDEYFIFLHVFTTKVPIFRTFLRRLPPPTHVKNNVVYHLNKSERTERIYLMASGMVIIVVS